MSNDNLVLRAALSYAGRGWPVFPCRPGHKSPATPHGYLDATTDPAQISQWFAGHPERNLAVSTGAPGPDVLDVDYRGPDADGFPALERLRNAELLNGTFAIINTPNEGFHLYFTGSEQSSSHLPDHHLDFLAQGGYVLVPPSTIGGRSYSGIYLQGEDDGLDWAACTQLLSPARTRQRSSPQPAAAPADEQVQVLARWVAAQREGNRNAGLFWAANRALDADQAADLSPLAAAARQAGLNEPEITRTLDSARRTRQVHPEPPDHEAEGTD